MIFRRQVELLKDALAYGTSSIVQKLIGFLLIPLYTRHLEPSDYGILAMLMVMQASVEAFVLLGQKSAVFRRVGLAQSDDERSTALTMGLVLVTSSGITAFILGQIFARELCDFFVGEEHDVNLVRISLCISFLNVLSEIPRIALQANRRAKLAATLTAVQAFATMIMAVLFVVVFGLGVWGILWASVAALIPICITYLVTVGRIYGYRWDKTITGELVQYGLPFVPHRIQMMLFAMFGEYLVRNKLGLDEVGLYNMAKKFALPLAALVKAITSAWWGYKFHIFKNEKDPGEAISSVTTYTMAGLTYIWVGVSLWAPEVLFLFTPEKFHGAAPLIPALALYFLFTGLYQMLTSGIELGDNARPILLVGFTGLVVVVPTSLYTVSFAGASGVAWSLCVAQLALTFTGYKIAQSRFKIQYAWRLNFFVFLVGVLLVVVGRYYSYLDLVPRLTTIVALSFAFPVFVLIMLARSPSERAQISKMLNFVRKK